MVNGPFTQCDIYYNVTLFSTQIMGSVATNGSVHTGNCVSNFYYMIDLHNEEDVDKKSIPNVISHKQFIGTMEQILL